MRIHPVLCLPLPWIWLLASCLPSMRAPSGNAAYEDCLSDSNNVSLYLPLEKLNITMVDQTHSLRLPPQNHLFYIEVVNALMQYEIAQRFRVLQVARTDCSVQTPERAFRSEIMADIGSPGRLADHIRSIAEQCSVDIVILPLQASVKETVSKKSGWRGDKFGRSYDRPFDCLAQAAISLQVWDRNGKMVYNQTGTGVSRKPLFYSLLKHEKAKREDLVHFSKNLFAPPVIRALSCAVKDAFPAKQPVSTRGRRY
ncbi:MAG: hypothetical protein JXA71_12105 [Chitinispirillaceae bacterium]|nr:hypothetical protein [Chitinispirillaceae bacterium]